MDNPTSSEKNGWLQEHIETWKAKVYSTTQDG